MVRATVISMTLVGALCAQQEDVSPARYYVALDGSDLAAGSLDAPYRTLGHAKQVVRKRLAAGMNAPLTVVVRQGVYELAAPLTFDARDSGTDAFAVTYAAYPGERVILSGGRRIEGMVKVGRLWQKELPAVVSGDWFFRHLTVSDRRAVRARWPDQDGALRIASVADEVQRFGFDRDIPARSLVGQSAEMVVYQNWSVTRGLIIGSRSREVQTATSMGWIGHGNSTTASVGKPVYLEHAREFLDQPGEWFLDPETGVLSYLPRDGEVRERSVVVAPVLSQLVRLVGTRQEPVRNVHFRGLSFENTAFPLPAFGYSEIQAAHYGPRFGQRTFVQPVAIACVAAEACRFDRCRIAHIGASGIGLGAGCRGVVVNGCVVEDIGGSGVMIGWRGVGKLGEASEGGLDADWADPADVPTDNVVSNCSIRRCGAASRGGVGVFVAFSAGTRIVNNLVHELPYTGISIGFRWNTSPTSQRGCLVECNHIHDVMRVLADGGGIYTLGWQPKTLLRGNYIHDVHRSRFAHGGAPNNGFFLDQGSKGLRIVRNVVHGTSGAAVRFNLSEREQQEWEANLFGEASASQAAAKAVMRAAGPRAGYR